LTALNVGSSINPKTKKLEARRKREKERDEGAERGVVRGNTF
jgi:hypothetical protein